MKRKPYNKQVQYRKNIIAKGLHSDKYRARVVVPKKGRGSYNRKLK